ncbi:MAG: resolvase [Clostridia bacterium]|nr:resolvase [Clostridia bacterium]
MATHKITVQKGGNMNETDRLTLATLLIKAGYTVRIVKEREGGKKTTVTSVEYTEA